MIHAALTTSIAPGVAVLFRSCKMGIRTLALLLRLIPLYMFKTLLHIFGVKPAALRSIVAVFSPLFYIFGIEASVLFCIFDVFLLLLCIFGKNSTFDRRASPAKYQLASKFSSLLLAIVRFLFSNRKAHS